MKARDDFWDKREKKAIQDEREDAKGNNVEGESQELEDGFEEEVDESECKGCIDNSFGVCNSDNCRKFRKEKYCDRKREPFYDKLHGISIVQIDLSVSLLEKNCAYLNYLLSFMIQLQSSFSPQKKLLFVTHSGSFHADDILAAATLDLVFSKQGYLFEFLRTRNADVIRSADIVFDVGGVYDPSIYRFDHHQVPGPEPRPDTHLPYSSFGLIWKHFGMLLCDGEQDVWEYIEKNLVLAIDAQDNGVELYAPVIPNIHPVLLHQLTRVFVPTWREREDGDGDDSAFFELVAFAKRFLGRMLIVARDMRMAEHYIRNIYANSENKECVILDRDVAWEDVLAQYPEPRLVVYPRITEEGGVAWRVQTVRDDVNGFANRCPFPESWRGKIGTDLEEASGVSGARFCHKAGFLAIADTKDAALALAHKALEQGS